MNKTYSIGKTVAVLGGGQLGTMLATAAQPLRINIHCLDPAYDAPASYNAQSFAEGEFTHRRSVESFGRHADAVTIEIEAVSIEGMKALRDDHGRKVHPKPESLEIIQDKGLQKNFYKKFDLPTAPYQLWDSEQDIIKAVEAGNLTLPFVQKLRKGGYDGKGVKIVKDENDLADLLPGACLTETLADLDKELAIVVARNEDGQIEAFPTVEMDFDPIQNLVTKLLSPARISEEANQLAKDLAFTLIEKFEICGLLAIEYFLLKDGTIWINEVAPRPHNSGHITMDGFSVSQFEQHLRGVLNLPLKPVVQYQPAAMVNILGKEGHTGKAQYENFEEVISMPGVSVHLYGKTVTKPHRKMGHVNIVASTIDEAAKIADQVRASLHVTAQK